MPAPRQRSLTASLALVGLVASSMTAAAPQSPTAGLRAAQAAPTPAAPSYARVRRPRFTPPPKYCTSSGFVGGGIGNVAGDAAGVLAGGDNEACGFEDAIGAGEFDLIYANGGYDVASFIGAGDNNSIYSNGEGGTYESFIGAGNGNTVTAWDAAIAAGSGNLIGPAGATSFIGGGYKNTSNGEYGFVGAGQSNVTDGSAAFVGAGDGNSAAGLEAVVAGGERNAASGAQATVSGGADSSATGKWATIPGGYLNAANGIGSFAAGTQAKARHAGAFVWSDNAGSLALQSTAPNQFMARASGGFYLYSNATENAGVRLAPGSGTWSSLSDRSMKTDITALDDATVLAKVAALPVSEWSYLSERGVRHVGPMAQDFYAAFRVGEDDRHIATLDEDGVALAAIKALHAENEGLRARLTRSDARLTQTNARVAELERKLDALAKQVSQR